MATKAIATRRVYARRPKSRSRAKMTIPLAIVAGFAPATMRLISAYRIGGIEAVPQHLSMITTGYDPVSGKFSLSQPLMNLWGPLAIGALVHKTAGRLGINRMLSRAGVPLLRI